MRPIFKIILLIGCLVGFGYYFKNEFILYFNQSISPVAPCSAPITYSIGTIDKRFGLTKDELSADLHQAELIWEKPVKKNLFTQAINGGDIKINLIYDKRQETTLALSKIGIKIDENEASYESLKLKYQALTDNHDQQKKDYNRQIAAYDNEKAIYEKDVQYWNSRGGAPPNEYAILVTKKNELNKTVDAINRAKDQLNQRTADINAVASGINRLINDLNLKVNNYNDTGDQRGQEFEEGEYTSDASGMRINIYEFNSKSQLVRVIAHELGHALGLEHVDSAEAIMYRINQGKKLELGAADINDLKKLCRIP
jgi:chromosome segregation ATPase